MRKLVGRLMSVVARNWTRTVWPRHAARLNYFCEYEPAAPEFAFVHVPSVERRDPDVLRTSAYM